MRVLITGATGFIGKYVTQSLLKKGIDFVTIGRATPGLNNSHINADLLQAKNIDVLIKKAGATHLIHLAWYAEHGKYWTSSLNNSWVKSSINLIESFCKHGGQGVVVAGTCAEYDWSYEHCIEDMTPTNPSTIYGNAKNETRKIVMEVCKKNNVPCSWGRIFLPFGKEENLQRLIPSLISVFLKQKKPFGVNSNSYRDFLYAHDIAEGLIFLLMSHHKGIFNISSGKPILISNLVYKIASLYDANPRDILDLSSERENEPKLLVGDNSKIQSLGWKPVFSLDEGLNEVIAYRA
jgi:nucleoside-diphosphate-sugar epimerase